MQGMLSRVVAKCDIPQLNKIPDPCKYCSHVHALIKRQGHTNML